MRQFKWIESTKKIKEKKNKDLDEKKNRSSHHLNSYRYRKLLKIQKEKKLLTRVTSRLTSCVHVSLLEDTHDWKRWRSWTHYLSSYTYAISPYLMRSLTTVIINHLQQDWTTCPRLISPLPNDPYRLNRGRRGTRRSYRVLIYIYIYIFMGYLWRIDFRDKNKTERLV